MKSDKVFRNCFKCQNYIEKEIERMKKGISPFLQCKLIIFDEKLREAKNNFIGFTILALGKLLAGIQF